MRFDDIDLKIFNAFVENQELTSTDLAKIIFNPKDRSELISKNTLIDYRLKKWLKEDLIMKKTIKNTTHYDLNEERITFGESILTVNGMKIEMGEALIIKMKNNGFIIKFWDEE